MLKKALFLHETGQIAEAAALYRNILAQNPKNADALHLLGVIEAQNNNSLAAIALIDRAIDLRPNSAAFFSNRGLALHKVQRFDDALASYDRAVAINPNYVEALNNRGLALHELRRLDDAIASYDRALAIKPDYAEALYNRGRALQETKRPADALASYDRALAIKPDHTNALNNRGLVLHNLGRFDQALASYARAVAIKPDYAEALNNRGLALQDLKRIDEALASYDRALAIKPNYVEAFLHRGNALGSLDRFHDALASYEIALVIEPDYLEAHINRGNVLRALTRFDEAIASYDRALAIKPDCTEALNNRGSLLRAISRLDGALASYDRTLAIKPDDPEALSNRAWILQVQGNIDQAIACLRHAVAIRPDDASLHTNLIFALNFDSSVSAADQQAERAQWDKAHARQFACHIKPHPNDMLPERRLRIGYVTPYFRRQAATYSFGGVILNHDPKGFEVICYSDTVEEDDVTARLRARADYWRLTADLSDDQLAASIRSDRIDILVDLVGHMDGHRLRAFARKPAPIQVTAWGEPTGTGLDAMDYLLADPVLVPESERSMLAERVVNLPNFLGYWTPEPLPEPGPLPALGKGHVTFGSFNRLDKITDPTIRSWASILRALPTAHLALKDRALEDARQRTRLEDAFSTQGVAPERLRLLGGSDRPSHFGAYRTIDIALDPFPHSGGMTTLDSLWMGVPAVTWTGRTISSRLAAACLTASGLTEFIAIDPRSYVDLAVAKATNLDALSRLRDGLRTQISTSEFGNVVRYTRAVEAAYRKMWQRRCAGAPHTTDAEVG